MRSQAIAIWRHDHRRIVDEQMAPPIRSIRRLATMMAVLLVLAPGRSRADAAEPWSRLLDSAGEARKSGAPEEAEKLYLQAWEGLDSPDTEPRQILRWAGPVQSMAIRRPHGRLADQLVQGYRYVLDRGKPAETAMAASNLALVEMARGEPSKAVLVFEEYVFQDGQPRVVDDFVYRFNYARSLELSERYPEAREQYWQSWVLRPSFTEAARAYSELLGNVEFPEFARTDRLVRELLARRRTELAGRLIYDQLHKWGAHSESDVLLERLLDYYAAVGLTHEDYSRRELPQLDKLAARHDRMSGLRDDLSKAFFSKRLMPYDSLLFHDPRQAKDAFPTWVDLLEKLHPESEYPYAALARVLRCAGDSYYLGPAARENAVEGAIRAVSRYSAAYLLDPTATDAALYAASALMSEENVIDPDGTHYQQFIRDVFTLKNSILLHAASHEDWTNLCYLHTVLANLYLRREQWRGPDQFEGVVFHAEAALKDAEQVRKWDPRFRVSPHVFIALGRAYGATGENKEAWEKYVEAAERFAELRAEKQATDTLAVATELAEEKKITLTEANSGRVERITGRIERIGNATLVAHTPSGRPLTFLGFFNDSDNLALRRGAGLERWTPGEGTIVSFPVVTTDRPRKLVAVSNNLDWLATSTDEQIEIYDVRFAERTATLTGSFDNVVSLAISPNGRLVVSGDRSGTVTARNARQGELLWQRQEPEGFPHLVFSGDGDRLAIAVEETLSLVDTETAETFQDWRASAKIVSLSANSDGSTVAAATAKGDATLFSSRGDRQFPGAGSHVALAPDDQLLAIADAEGRAVVWDYGTETRIADLQTGPFVSSMFFSGDGKLLAIGSRNGGEVWEIK